MPSVTNLTGRVQIHDGVRLPPGRAVAVSAALAARLYGREGYAVTWEATRPWRDVVSDQGSRRLLWQSPFSVSDGYAVAAEHTLGALRRAGVEICVQDVWFRSEHGLQADTLQALRAARSGTGAEAGYEVGLSLALPQYFAALPTPRRIGWTMWETTDPIEHFHRDWPEQTAVVDALWVPTAWQVRVFERFYRGPVAVVPLAISPLYQLLRRPVRETFTVVTWGALTSRKCPQETLAVFERAFPRDRFPQCRLRVKTKCGLFGDRLNALPEVDDPRITIYDDVWLPDRMLGFLYEADCGLFLSRGEGFGMPAREAIATGLPAVLSDHSGHADVALAAYTWPAPTARMEKSPMGGEWWTTDYDAAVDQLRTVYADRAGSLAKAARGAEWFQATWGGAEVARRIIETLDGSADAWAK